MNRWERRRMPCETGRLPRPAAGDEASRSHDRRAGRSVLYHVSGHKECLDDGNPFAHPPRSISLVSTEFGGGPGISCSTPKGCWLPSRIVPRGSTCRHHHKAHGGPCTCRRRVNLLDLLSKVCTTIPVDLVKYSSEILVNGEWESFWTNPVERDENVSTTGGPRGAKSFFEDASGRTGIFLIKRRGRTNGLSFRSPRGVHR